jgi:lambda family phage portal protein
MFRRQPITRGSTAETFESLRADYQAAKSHRYRRRRTGVSPAGSGADYHYRSEGDYLRMMEYARDMDRNDVIVGQTIDRAVVNTIQDGFALDTRTGDEGLDRDLAALWSDWSSDPEQCDIAGELAFADMERLAFRQMIVDGDVLALPQRSGSLQMVEAHRLRTPSNTKRNVVHGVLLDDVRRRLEYWLTKDDIDPMKSLARVSDTKSYPARDDQGYRMVFHMYHPRRVSQTRGVTALAPIFDVTGMFEDINFSKMIQQQVVSCFVVFRERELGFNLDVDVPRGERSTMTLADATTRTVEGLAPGMEIPGLPGEKLRMDSPNVPNPEFFPHVKLMLTLIGVNLGLPLAVVLLDPSETNFSGWRGAIDQARLGFRTNQRALIRRFHAQVYKWKVRQWAKLDPALRRVGEKDGVNLFEHRFNPPSWPYIEPLKDAAADLLRIRNTLISQRRRCGERGMDWDELSTEIVDDNAMIIRKAQKKAEELNAEFPGLGVTWRELASLPTPDGVNVKLSAAGDERSQSNRREDPDNE